MFGIIKRVYGTVPKVGIEPTYPFGYTILSRARLPVPPLRRCGASIVEPVLFVKLQLGIQNYLPASLSNCVLVDGSTAPQVCRTLFPARGWPSAETRTGSMFCVIHFVGAQVQ